MSNCVTVTVFLTIAKAAGWPQDGLVPLSGAEGGLNAAAGLQCAAPAKVLGGHHD